MNQTKKNSPNEFDKGFRQFRLGMSLFFCGMVFIYCAHQLLPPSFKQELLAGLAVILVVVGFVMAIVAEGRLILARFVDFFFKK